jgi:hypothetical protein
MAHTLETVLKQLGDEAQLVGGRIIVFRDGKHTDVGGIGMSDAVFSLTEAGKALLEDAPAPKADKKADKKTSGLKAEVAPANLEDLDLGDLA